MANAREIKLHDLGVSYVGFVPITFSNRLPKKKGRNLKKYKEKAISNKRESKTKTPLKPKEAKEPVVVKTETSEEFVAKLMLNFER